MLSSVCLRNALYSNFIVDDVFSSSLGGRLWIGCVVAVQKTWFGSLFYTHTTKMTVVLCGNSFSFPLFFHLKSTAVYTKLNHCLRLFIGIFYSQSTVPIIRSFYKNFC